MEKTHAFILAILLTLLIFTNFYLFSIPDKKRTSVLITRVIDGDTLEIEGGKSIRLLNINTPEKGEHFYQEALNFLKSFENKTVEMEFLSKDKYGRTLARIYALDYLNLKLVENGLGTKFLVDENEIKLFADAEENAVKNSEGMWKKSQYAECLSSEIDEKNEIIYIKSSCGKLNFTSWYLKDESRKKFIFPYLETDAVNIHTKNGTNNQTDLFWALNQNVWNNDRDTLYVFDSQAALAVHKSYGY